MTQTNVSPSLQLSAEVIQTMRQRAENRLKEAVALTDGVEPLSPSATHELLHDLQVHQIELEMQNEELRRTQAELSVLQEHYSDLFDWAPVGYVTINAQGTLLEANLTAATMLGVKRSVLPSLPFTLYILKQDHGIFHLHLKLVLDKHDIQSFDLRMLKSDGGLFWANLTLTFTSTHRHQDKAVLRLTISDITERKHAQALFRALFDQSVFIRCILDKQFRLMEVNRAALSLMDTPLKALIGQYFPDNRLWTDEHNQAELMHALQQAICCVGTQFETFHTLPNGKPLYLMVNTTPIFLDTGIQIAFVGVDITERKQIEQALKRSEKLFHDFFESNSSVMLLIEPIFGQLIDANHSAVTFYGYSREQLMAMYLCHINVTVPEQSVAHSKQAHQEGRRDLVHTHKLASGDIRYVEVHSTPVEMAGRAMLFSIIHDVTERYLLEKQVHQLAFHDALTQLPNRSLLNDRMTQIMAISHRSGCFCALMMVDLDNFKPINDIHGHLVGDLMLIEVARRLTLCVREVDTVARFGGDEFVVMLSELSTDKAESTAQAATVAEKIIHSLAEPYLLTVSRDNAPDTLTEHRCTVSLGVFVFINGDISREAILNGADAAMYQAKNDGGNRIRFYATEGERERPSKS